MCMCVWVCVCMDDMKETGVGGRPQGHHHVNGDALAGHGLCHLPIRPNPMLTWYIHRANYPEDNLVRICWRRHLAHPTQFHWN